MQFKIYCADIPDIFSTFYQLKWCTINCPCFLVKTVKIMIQMFFNVRIDSRFGPHLYYESTQ